ncbi:MAG TPA: serine hydrolase domain-containing protein [Streptosporangiaceae bacterium]
MIDQHTHRLLTARLAAEQAARRLPSVSAGLLRGGGLAWSAGRGRIRGTSGPVPDAGVQYRAGSITKSFVAVAVLRLRDAGRIDLSDPVGAHLDAGEVAHLTIGQLLSHTSGLRAETAGPWWERTAGISLPELTAGSLGPDAARLRPGRRYHYSSVGYALLGALVARLHDAPWYEVIAGELLAPLGMNRTTLAPQAPHAAGFAVHPHADLLLPEPEHDAAAMGPAGQLWTTVADLARWARFLAGDTGGLLAEATLAEMREPVTVHDAAGAPWAQGYGLGLQLWNDGGARSYGHSGSMPGFTAIVQIAADSGDAAIALCNSTAGFGDALSTDLLTILAEREPRIRAEWTPAAVAGDVLELAGPWYWGPVSYLLRVTGGELELTAAASSLPGLRFGPDGDGGWTGLDGRCTGEPLVPLRGPGGEVRALDFGSVIFTRTPYDPQAPVPGGVDPGGWRAG